MCRGCRKTIPGYNATQLEGEELTDVKLVSGKTVKVDSCIAPLVQALNDYGIKTRYSCCRHGVVPTSEIIIDEENVEIQEHPTVISLVFPYPGDKYG